VKTCLSTKVIVAVAPLLLAATPLDAQYCQSLSIDSFVAMGNQVLIGRVLSVASAPGDGDVGPAGTITLAVEETLKGNPVQGPLDIPFANWDYFSPGPFYPDKSGPRISSHRLLVALRHASRRPAKIAAIDLDAASLAVMNADLVVLRTSAEVLRAAREALRRIPPGDKRSEASNGRRLAIPSRATLSTFVRSSCRQTSGWRTAPTPFSRVSAQGHALSPSSPCGISSPTRISVCSRGYSATQTRIFAATRNWC
jgi:hypothetical protein